MNTNTVETLIGAFVIAVAALFLGFAYTTSDVGRVSGYRVSAEFESVAGIGVGSDVRMAGIKIGSVVGQRLDPQTYFAELQMSIDSQVEIPADSSVKVAIEGLLGDSYLSIEPGGSMEALAAGDEFRHTQGAIDIVGLLSQAIFSTDTSSSGP